MEFDKVIESRHSVRNFKKGKKPNYQDIISAIDSARQGPLAGNQPSLKYIIITEKEKIKELSEACQQDFIKDVEYCVVVCSDKKFLKKSYYERGEIYARQEAGAAIGTILLKLTELGLSSCWVGAFADEIVKRILKIPAPVDVEAILPIGYEMGKVKKKFKPELDSMIFYDGYGGPNSYMGKRNIISGSKT